MGKLRDLLRDIVCVRGGESGCCVSFRERVGDEDELGGACFDVGFGKLEQAADALNEKDFGPGRSCGFDEAFNAQQGGAVLFAEGGECVFQVVFAQRVIEAQSEARDGVGVGVAVVVVVMFVPVVVIVMVIMVVRMGVLVRVTEIFSVRLALVVREYPPVNVTGLERLQQLR